jgi:hypothetical protein
MGRTGPLVDAEPARQHVRALMAAGVAYARIAAAAGVNTSTVNHMLYPRPNRPVTARLNHDNARRILSVQADDVVTGLVDATGSARRIRALMAIGWPPMHLGPYIRVHPHYVTEIHRADKVYATTAHAVAVTYNALWNQNPQHHGVSQQATNRFRNYARDNEWAPPAAWDDDQIDSPDAHPDWTGYCGTDRGFWTHRLQKIPGCARCTQAHERWLADHAHLDGVTRNKLAFAQRSTAASREAELAEDGRELLRLGADYEQAAERLGVTRNHLQQAMLRHPEPLPAAA